MGSVFSVSAPSRSLTWMQSQKSYDGTGRPFVDMIKDNPTYGPWMDLQTKYEIKVDCSKPHWRLLIRKANEPSLPFFSLEVTTSNMFTLVQGTHTFDSCGEEVKDVGIYDGTLCNICKLADEVHTEMSSYSLTDSNCQDFCNKLLGKMNKRQFSTIFDDFFREIIPDEAPSRTSSNASTRRRSRAENKRLSFNVHVGPSTTASRSTNDDVAECIGLDDVSGVETETDLDSPLRKPDLEDLKYLVEKMLPLQPYWENIGKSLSLDSATLSAIAEDNKVNKPCLREMLRNYLTSDHASFQQLASVVQGYTGGRPIAKDIVKRGT